MKGRVLTNSSHEHQYKDSVKHQMLGPIPMEDMPGMFSATYALMFTTVYRGFGMPAYEAMACGCPVVVYSDWHFNYPQAAAIVKGFRNHEGIRDAITQVMDHSKRDSMVPFAIKESERYGGITGEHSWNEMAYDMLDHLIFGEKRGKECDEYVDHLTKP